MKKILILLTCIVWMPMLKAQVAADSTNADTAQAAEIIDRYIKIIDFDRIIGDSMLYVESWVVERDNPNDTMFIYRWYMSGHRLRIEMWQKGKMEDAYVTDGKNIFHRFSKSYRDWKIMSQISFYDMVTALDVRGALYDWRAKGSEAKYMGEYEYQGKPVDRVFVATPELFDRNYFFEKETGLLFLLTEEDHIFGDAKKAVNAEKLDWRGWSEFVPLRGCYLPSVESYQQNGQVVIIHHSYRLEAANTKLFTENFRKK